MGRIKQVETVSILAIDANMVSAMHQLKPLNKNNPWLHLVEKAQFTNGQAEYSKGKPELKFMGQNSK